MTYFFIAALVVAAIAAWTDLRNGNIPNWLTLSTIGLGLIAHFIRGYRYAGLSEGAFQVAYSLAGALICGLTPAVMYRMKGMGGGDVKLFAAIGILCHPLGGLEIETYALVVAALVAPARLIHSGVFMKTLTNSFSVLMNPLRKKENRVEVPSEMLTWFRLGPCVFVAALAATVTNWGLS